MTSKLVDRIVKDQERAMVDSLRILLNPERAVEEAERLTRAGQCCAFLALTWAAFHGISSPGHIWPVGMLALGVWTSGIIWSYRAKAKRDRWKQRISREVYEFLSGVVDDRYRTSSTSTRLHRLNRMYLQSVERQDMGSAFKYRQEIIQWMCRHPKMLQLEKQRPLLYRRVTFSLYDKLWKLAAESVKNAESIQYDPVQLFIASCIPASTAE